MDLNSLARDTENGKIKGISFTQYGAKVEMSDPDKMLQLLAQMKGLVVNKIDADVKSENINVDVSPEEAADIWDAIKKEI